MRFPHPDTNKICFLAEDPDTLKVLMGDECSDEEAELISAYCAVGLPPITSPAATATMFGYNPGFVGALMKRPERHYRRFTLSKGGQKDGRPIAAPKVGLKLIQRTLNHHWSAKWTAPDCVHGFVSGRSHVSAAHCHVGAVWVISADIENFFPSVGEERVEEALRVLGYKDQETLENCRKLVCLDGALTQGAPTSPLLSNIVLRKLDEALLDIAAEHEAVYTRYADDIVFSGRSVMPAGLADKLREVIVADGWRISEDKFESVRSPMRLKVHGLLVHGDDVRLTKGYRNKIRAFKHLLAAGKISEETLPKVRGHISYSSFIDRQKKE